MRSAQLIALCGQQLGEVEPIGQGFEGVGCLHCRHFLLSMTGKVTAGITAANLRDQPRQPAGDSDLKISDQQVSRQGPHHPP